MPSMVGATTITLTVGDLARVMCSKREDGAHYDYDYAPCSECRELAEQIAAERYSHYLVEGWWHPNVKSGQVHDHDFTKQPQTMHRLCEAVYTRRPGNG